jgi:hypothetical protein
VNPEEEWTGSHWHRAYFRQMAAWPANVEAAIVADLALLHLHIYQAGILPGSQRLLSIKWNGFFITATANNIHITQWRFYSHKHLIAKLLLFCMIWIHISYTFGIISTINLTCVVLTCTLHNCYCHCLCQQQHTAICKTSGI